MCTCYMHDGAFEVPNLKTAILYQYLCLDKEEAVVDTTIVYLHILIQLQFMCMLSTSVYCDLTQSGLHYIYRCYIIPYTEQATHYKQKVPKVMVLFIIVSYIIWYDDKVSRITYSQSI